MLSRRLQYGFMALVGALLPSLISWGVMLAVYFSRVNSLSQIQAPNPTKAPWYFMGPIELLVYFDPWFSGTIIFWLYLWGAILVGFALLSVLLLPPRDQDGLMSSISRWHSFAFLSLMVGCVFAAPWLYTLVRFVLQGATWDVA
jgi:hypothetical protein